MLTVTQYAKALSTLSDKRKAILFKMYRQGPFADSNVIAQILGYKGFTAVNLHLGSIGKYISDVIGVPSNYYYDYKGGKRLAYFHFVHYWTGEVWYLQPNLQKAIERLGWSVELSNEIESLPTDEVVYTRALVLEGKVTQVLVNRYERDKKAIKIAEKIHGRICIGCKIDFKAVYGNDIKTLIHFHHTRPLGEVQKEEVKDVAKDIIPLCPNCHFVVHSTFKIMTLKELQKRILKQKKVKKL